MAARVLAGTVFELPDGGQKVVEMEREDVLVVHAQGHFYAVSNICTHAEYELCGGPVEGHRIKCTGHGSWFDLETGAALNLPAVRPVKTYRTVVEDGKVYVEERD
jgi:3-phenylpropionate/trans-cinnamate dioxygenase ferredoxin subunit